MLVMMGDLSQKGRGELAERSKKVQGTVVESCRSRMKVILCECIRSGWRFVLRSATHDQPLLMAMLKRKGESKEAPFDEGVCEERSSTQSSRVRVRLGRRRQT